MAVNLTPGSLIYPVITVVWGPGFTTSPHQHHCVQLAVGLTGTFRVRCGIQRRWLSCAAVWIAPDVSYELDADGVFMLVVWVDPESDLGAGLSRSIGSAMRIIPDFVVTRWREQL